MKRVVVILNFWRLILPCILYLFDNEFREVCMCDLERIRYTIPRPRSIYGFCYALIFNIPYRGVFYYRSSRHKILRGICNILLPNRREVEISGDIRPGLAVFHGQGLVLHCKSAGENLSVWQNVTVGRNPSKKDQDGKDIPSIGHDVNIYTGSIVAGGVSIGNNVDIGAGSVVLKDVPDNCVVAGNPAKVIKMKEISDVGDKN